MKKALSILSFLFILSCSTDSATDNYSPPSNNGSSGPCKYNGHTLHRGLEGGCYYVNSSGNKEYVDRSYCNC